MSNIEEPRPGTTASVERHVEKLAEKVDAQDRVVGALVTDFAVMKAEQSHLRELMQAEFKALAAGQSVQTAKLDAIAIQLNDSQVKAAQAMGDPMETPAGRAVMQVVNDVVGRTAGVEKKVYMAAGAVALITFLAPIIAPLVRAMIGLP